LVSDVVVKKTLAENGRAHPLNWRRQHCSDGGWRIKISTRYMQNWQRRGLPKNKNISTYICSKI